MSRETLYGMRVTPENITVLEPNEIFVFGSNITGRHGAGAARVAALRFGAEYGIGAGLTGRCYAIPTMEGWNSLQRYVNQFLEVAQLLPQFTFLLTKIGCGLAGHAEEDVKGLFIVSPKNVIKPPGW